MNAKLSDMTESEAIKILQRDLQIQLENKALPDGIEAIQIAIQSLEKQIPKKPNKTIDSSWGIKKEVHVCPVCDYYLTEVHFIAQQKIESNKKITYCEICGQAIDWSDEE